jgi:hypothetical protein
MNEASNFCDGRCGLIHEDPNSYLYSCDCSHSAEVGLIHDSTIIVALIPSFIVGLFIQRTSFPSGRRDVSSYLHIIEHIR